MFYFFVLFYVRRLLRTRNDILARMTLSPSLLAWWIVVCHLLFQLLRTGMKSFVFMQITKWFSTSEREKKKRERESRRKAFWSTLDHILSTKTRNKNTEKQHKTYGMPFDKLVSVSIICQHTRKFAKLKWCSFRMREKMSKQKWCWIHILTFKFESKCKRVRPNFLALDFLCLRKNKCLAKI